MDPSAITKRRGDQKVPAITKWREDQKVQAILESAEHAVKPNFTQYQLALAELRAPPKAYRTLRQIMERRFNLESLDEVVYE
jgi:hypothetical protein